MKEYKMFKAGKKFDKFIEDLQFDARMQKKPIAKNDLTDALTPILKKNRHNILKKILKS